MDLKLTEQRRDAADKRYTSLALAALLGLSVTLGACADGRPFGSSDTEADSVSDVLPSDGARRGPDDAPSEVGTEVIDESQGSSSSQ